MEITKVNFLYQRVLDSLIKEIEAFDTEEKVWMTANGINNSSGNLVLHIIGGLDFFIGGTIGKTGYVRDRDAEFATKGLTKAELVSKITATKNMLAEVLPSLSAESLAAPYAFEFAGKESTEMYINFFVGHCHYHLGQISYLRRVLG